MWRKLQIRAAQSRSFWKLLRTLRRINFEIKKRSLLASETLVSSRTEGRILISLTRTTLRPLLFALGTATVLLVINVYLPAPTWRWVPLPLWHMENTESYGTFLSTISGIGGVLIGLYYAGLTAVSSAAYARAPGIIRDLLLRDPVGRLYIRLLAYTTFLSLCLLAFYGVGFSPIRPAVPLLIALSGIAILSFVRLGQQAFYFFDPTTLAQSAFADLERWTKRATVASYFWADPTFQQHANRQAQRTLKALTTLAEYASRQKYLRSDAIANLAKETIGFLYRYENSRQLIPPESKWYPPDYEHPDFYTAGDLKIDMATKTGGPIPPSTTAQPNWVQEIAFPVVFKALHTNLAERDESSVSRILQALQNLTEHFAHLGELEEAIGIAEQAAEVISPILLTADWNTGDAARLGLGIVESLCLLPITALLGFVKSLENSTLGRVRHLLAKVQWQKPKTLYRAGFPRFILPTMEWFRHRIDFEFAADERQITPQWLIEQGILKDYLNWLHTSIGLLLVTNTRLYSAWHKRAAQAKQHWPAAMILSRQGEYLAKLRANFNRMSATEAEYESAKVVQDMLGWPTKQAEALREKIDTIEREYKVAAAKEAHQLALLKRPSHVPDFAGEFLSLTARTVLEAILNDDMQTFVAVFPYFFEASTSMTVSMMSSLQGHNDLEQQQRLNAALGPFFNLLELSGYAKLASELRQSPEPWSTANARWDQYLSDQNGGATRRTVTISALRTADNPWMAASGELMRTGWRMQIQQLLEGLPTEDIVHGGVGIYIEHRVKHTSALVRVLAAQGLQGFYRGTDVFAATYLMKFPEHEGLELRCNDLHDAIARESERPKEKQ